MPSVETVLLVVALLFIVSILASKASVIQGEPGLHGLMPARAAAALSRPAHNPPTAFVAV